MRERRITSIIVFATLFLLPLTVRSLEIDIDLNFGEFYGIYREADTGWRIEGSFAAANAIDFFICDAGNYSKWIENQATILYEHQEQVATHAFNLTIPHDGVWYVIFSNAYVTSNNTLEIEIQYLNQVGVEQNQVKVITKNMISTPAVVMFIAAGLGISILGIWWARRREPRPAVRYDEILSKPS
ncbi:MAG: hypothetical protein ACFFEA_08930 [Candidatus Thorarchaeota archaeon]